MVHIHFTRTHDMGIRRGQCPDCNRFSFFLWFYQNWYGPDETCLRCGRRWEDGEWCSLPFCRTARQDSIDAAKARWRRGIEHTPKEPKND